MDRIDNIFVERNGVYNHWGIWVNPELPITGVISNNEIVQFISDEMYNGIDLDYEEHLKSPFHNEIECDCLEYYPDNRTNWLIGDWIKDKDGLYDYDPKGEYAAVVREDVTQVIFSKYTRKSALCSPCYPGQADNDTPGEYLSYDLPPEAYEVY